MDFKVGYSPERINPGDKVHRLETITKIVSGMDAESLEEIAHVYELVVEVGVHRASSIKVAEAAQVIENSQRDINIAFMNELSIIFNKMGIDTKSVLEAAGTKWNFLKFYPGLVGGHCIGVDPYYLTYKAEMMGYHSQIILAGRRINDDMGKYVAENCVKNLIKAEKQVKGARVAILGFTFKENCPDNLPKTEGREGNLLSPYALTKRCDEEWAKQYTMHYGLDTYGLRYFNVFGRRQDPNGAYAAVIPKFIKLLMNDERPTINDDGRQSRDFTYIENVIEANLKACLASHDAAGEAFNIAYGAREYLIDIYHTLTRALGKDIEPIYGPDRKGDIKHSNADIGKARRLLGYEPEYSFERGLNEAIVWYKENLQSKLK